MTEDVPLREHVNTVFQMLQAERIKDSQEISRRLDLLNGEAGRLRSMQETYLPREVAESKFKQLNDDITSLKLYKAEMEGKASSWSVVVTALLAVASLVIGIIGLIR